MSEVQKHNTKDSAWVVLHGQIYDLTEFLQDHPGGADVVLKWSGKCKLSDPKFGFSSVCMVKFTGGSGDGVYKYVRKNFTDIFNWNL